MSTDGNGIAPSSPIPGTQPAQFRFPEPSPLPVIEPHERPGAEFIVYEAFKASFGKYPPRVAGFYIAVQIYQRTELSKFKLKDGTEATILAADRTISEDKYQSSVGLIVSMGPQAYRGTNFDGTLRFPEGPWATVGSWVVVPRYEGVQVTVNGAPLLIMPDDKILAMVEDPTDVIATHLTDR